MTGSDVTIKATREPLSRERVLSAAMELADGEGLQAVTMRRLAAALGVEAMSLYHHLPGKDALLGGLVEALVDEIQVEIDRPPQPVPEQDRRAALRLRCLAARQVMVRHPWGPGLIGSRSNVPFSAYLLFEGMLATMVKGGLSYHLGHKALHALGSMVLGYAQEIFAPPAAGDGPDTADADAEFAPLAEALPYIATMVAAEMHDHDDPVLGWCDSQTEFEFTLDLLLDGLERKHEAGF